MIILRCAFLTIKPMQLPTYEEKQRLLYATKGPRPGPETLTRYGELYRSAGNLDDAIEFFHAAANAAALGTVQEQARREGDLFLFEKTAVYLKQAPTPADYVKVGEQAMQLGKLAFARRAFEKAGRADLVEKCVTP
jgi:tetratricopeptide (TPR) repeat protein